VPPRRPAREARGTPHASTGVEAPYSKTSTGSQAAQCCPARCPSAPRPRSTAPRHSSSRPQQERALGRRLPCSCPWLSVVGFRLSVPCSVGHRHSSTDNSRSVRPIPRQGIILAEGITLPVFGEEDAA